jgi:hypothetical protein
MMTVMQPDPADGAILEAENLSHKYGSFSALIIAWLHWHGSTTAQPCVLSPVWDNRLQCKGVRYENTR